MANGDGTGGNHGKRDIDDLDKEVNPRTGSGTRLRGDANKEPNACNGKK